MIEVLYGVYLFGVVVGVTVLLRMSWKLSKLQRQIRNEAFATRQEIRRQAQLNSTLGPPT